MKPKLNSSFKAHSITGKAALRLVVPLILLTLFTLPLFSQDLMVEYLEGYVEISSGYGWEELFIGDEIPADATVRVSENGFAELSAGAVTITISEDGTYLIKDLMGTSKEVASWGIGSLVSHKIKTALASTRGSEQSAVMGVRGSITSETQIDWMEEDEADEFLGQGKELFAAERYAEAVEIFKQGLEVADFEKEDLFLYYIAQSYTLMGEKALAIKTLSDTVFDHRSAMYTDLVLLKGSLLIESLAFQKALEIFTSHLQHYPEGGTAQAILILSSFCYRGLKDLDLAKDSLQKAAAINPESELAREAKRMIREL